ncbi:adhesion G protein-coupled receptor E3-like [Mya arenaria]|uniref:adhesion G protein-coupled receptor E3-like n=1 Tax=Mya arenaria TaxID=6604 RepID=UPI0022E56F52|nr:adhesion G protein-coupled receptor E3-like [Mya arenaria]
MNVTFESTFDGDFNTSTQMNTVVAPITSPIPDTHPTSSIMTTTVDVVMERADEPMADVSDISGNVTESYSTTLDTNVEDTIGDIGTDSNEVNTTLEDSNCDGKNVTGSNRAKTNSTAILEPTSSMLSTTSSSSLIVANITNLDVTTTTSNKLTIPPESTTQAQNPGEILHNVPDGENGTKSIAVVDFYQMILARSNMSVNSKSTTTERPVFLPGPGPGPLHVRPINGPMGQGHLNGSSKPNGNQGFPITEVKFQVSGFNKGPVGPLRGGSKPPLLIDEHVTSSASLQNLSRVLKTLREQALVDNATMAVFAETVSSTVTNVDAMNQSDEMKRDVFSDVMQVSEDLLDSIVDPEEEVDISTQALEIRSRVFSSCLNEELNVDFGKPGCDISASLSDGLFRYLNTTDVRISTLTYRKMDTFIHASSAHISSIVVAVTVHAVKGNKTTRSKIRTKDAITFEMRTSVEQSKQEERRECTFWDYVLSNWSPEGCSVVRQNSSHTTCTCNHLTSFAILVMYVQTKDISIQSEQALFTLTTVGCSLSIACLLMALITYIYLRMLGREKVMIHANLSLSLMLGQIVFVSSSDAHKNPVACKAVAVLLHFLFMSAFSWMLVEGLALYLCCTKGIFNHRDMRVKYFLLGWGLPLIIVIISFAARFPDYGNGPQYSCWLSIDDGVIWAFLGPMLVIVLLNIVVMGLVVKVFLTLKANSEKTEVARLKGSLRAMFTLHPLLGLTWILSLLVPFSVVFHYFFVIVNTVQGMCIFFLHCICNEEIRKKFYERRRRWSTTRTGSDADMNLPARRKRGSFDTIKAGAAGTHATIEYGNALFCK